MAKPKSRNKSSTDSAITKTESTSLTLFIPSNDRFQKPINQATWRESALSLLGKLFSGATAFPKGHGVWRDDAQDGKLIFDETIVIFCYTNRKEIEANKAELHKFLVTMGMETNQGAVGFVIDQVYMEIRFPLRTEESGDD